MDAPGTQATTMSLQGVPAQPSERRAWLLAATIALLGLVALTVVLAGVVGPSGQDAAAPPPVPVVAATPGATAVALAGATSPSREAIVSRPSAAPVAPGAPRVAIARRWMEGFYPIYATAQGAFGVDWLLIASIHMQETAFSTAPGTYRGLNFAHCCGGPMQFNVTNRPVTTWSLVSDSYMYGTRPAAYDHMTRAHPSIYDDFDSIMAAAHLLSADGAGYLLDGSAWTAAYDYYGHDQEGVAYADEVLARAIGWSQHGFCFDCGVDQRILTAVHAAYGAPVAAALAAPAPPRARATRTRGGKR